jgi:uncharacterized membrane protein
VSNNLSNRENVIVVSFSDDSKAYEGMSTLKELDEQDQLDLAGVAVVVRSDDGQVHIKDAVGDDSFSGTLGGGLVGLLIGIIGGPFGVLLGGATGVLVGSLFDAGDEDDTESALSDVSKSVRVGRTALLADVGEQSTDVVDNAMRELGGEVLRRSADEVEAEVAATEKAQRTAKREARKELLKARHEQHKNEIKAKIEELKAKLHLGKKAEAAAS